MSVKNGDMEICVYNAKGRIVRYGLHKAEKEAWPGQIDEAIKMIEGGCPAHLAMQLTKVRQP